MERKTLKRGVKEVAIDCEAPGLPSSVSRLRPTLFQEGQGYMAWYEGDGKKYYGFGKAPKMHCVILTGTTRKNSRNL